MFRKMISAAAILAAMSGSAFAKEPITLWFWGAPPNLQDALQQALIDPFNASQDKYELSLDYNNDVDNNVRVAVLAGQGPDLVYTSGPSYIAPLAKAGALEPLDDYAKKYGWGDKLLKPVLDTCNQLGHLYCMPPALVSDGMFYNKALLAEKGWAVPKTVADLETIMKAAQTDGLYASVTGNKGWQPVNEDYASTFINLIVGPSKFYDILANGAPWDSVEMKKAIDESARWFQAGYLGGKDYFSLNFDQSISLLSQKKAPFFFARRSVSSGRPTTSPATRPATSSSRRSRRWMRALPIRSTTSASLSPLSINAHSKNKDGAAEVLNMIFSPEYAARMAKVWPGYWGIPLKNFPQDPNATGLTKSFQEAMGAMTTAIDKGTFGFKIGTFFPPATGEVMFKDIEAVWLGKATAEDMLKKAATTYADEKAKGLTQPYPKPNL